MKNLKNKVQQIGHPSFFLLNCIQIRPEYMILPICFFYYMFVVWEELSIFARIIPTK